MSLEELQKDAEEFGKLLEQATRTRVKNALTMAKAEVEKEIVNFEMKARIAAERQANGQGVSQKRYLVELTEYAWDQSDRFVKLFITLDGVQHIDESKVTVTFADNSMILHVSDMNGKDYGLTVNNLVGKIDVEKSYRKVKTDLIAIYMKKVQEGKKWDHLTSIQKRLKEKQDKEMKSDMDNAPPEESLVNIMKKLYNSGDTKTKQMIAKAWTESQDKIHTQMPTSMPD